MPPISDVVLRPGAPTVLFLDRSEAIRRVAVRGLERRRYRVMVAAAPREALALLSRHAGAIDVVVSDVFLPADGLTTGYLFTSAGMGEDIRGVLRARARTAFLPKPWTITQLDAGIREVLRSRDAPADDAGV